MQNSQDQPQESDNLNIVKNSNLPTIEVIEQNTLSVVLQIKYPEKYDKFFIQSKEKRSKLGYQTALISDNSVAYLTNLKPNSEYFIRCCVQLYNAEQTVLENGQWSNFLLVKTKKRFTFIEEMMKSNTSILTYNTKLRNELQSYQVPQLFKNFGIESLNIMLLGSSDSGKSSFLNSIESALKNRYVELHNTMNHVNIVTRRLQKFRINKSQSISIWDSFGIQDNNYDKILKLLFQGRLKEGFDQYYGHRPHQSQIKQRSNLGEQIHSVILCISVETIVSKNVDKINEISSIIKKIQDQFDIQPLVIITKIDKVIQQRNIFQSSQIFEYGLIHEYISQLSDLIPSITKSQIYPHTNFTGYKDFPDEWVSSLQLRIVKLAKEQSEFCLQRKLRNSFEVLDQDNKLLGYLNTDSIDQKLINFRQNDDLKYIIQNSLIENYKFKKKDQQIKKDEESLIRLSQIINRSNHEGFWQLKLQTEQKKQDDYNINIEQKPTKESFQKTKFIIYNMTQDETQPIGFCFQNLKMKLSLFRNHLTKEEILGKNILFKFVDQNRELIKNSFDEKDIILEKISKNLSEEQQNVFGIYIRTLNPQIYFKINKGYGFVTDYFDVHKTIQQMRKWIEITYPQYKPTLKLVQVLFRDCPVSQKQEKRFIIQDVIKIESDNGQDKIVINLKMKK